MRILFIGNSFTYYNNLPNVLKQLSEKAGHTISVSMHAGSNKSLSDHLYDSDAILKIQDEQWDYVVLQEHSLYALENKASFENSLKQFVKIIKDKGSTPILFETWPREHLPQTANEIHHFH